MNITDIKIRKLDKEGKMKAVASVLFDGVFVVHDIKIIQTEQKTFIAMPNKRIGDTVYKDIVHPITAEFRSELEDAILKAYSEMPEVPEE